MRDISDVLVCSWVFTCLSINGDRKLVPATVIDYTDGISWDSTSLSHLINIIWYLSIRLAHERYGSEGVRKLYLLVSANVTPLVSHITRAYRMGIKKIEEEIRESVSLPFLVHNRDACTEAKKIVEKYCRKYYIKG